MGRNSIESSICRVLACTLRAMEAGPCTRVPAAQPLSSVSCGTLTTWPRPGSPESPSPLLGTEQRCKLPDISVGPGLAL